MTLVLFYTPFLPNIKNRLPSLNQRFIILIFLCTNLNNFLYAMAGLRLQLYFSSLWLMFLHTSERSASRGRRIAQTFVFWLTSGDALLCMGYRLHTKTCARVTAGYLPPSGEFVSGVRLRQGVYRGYAYRLALIGIIGNKIFHQQQ
jgi:hypothetical protein